ncbi:MAG: hypothetical protein L6455_02265, partial [Kiritimatiellae bacterium]|nr:hypothetical protein [Kiritimatiellia bacterium]
TGEPSAAIRERVKVARQVQHHRFKGLRKVHCNAALRPKEIQKHCALKPDAQDMLKMAITELHFSARAYDRILKVSRTIADLDGSKTSSPSTCPKRFSIAPLIDNFGYKDISMDRRSSLP